MFAETADITVGDAWLPKYEKDSGGTSVVVVRDAELGQLIVDAQKEARVLFHPEEVSQIVQSQAGGLRDRREGLAHRLYLKKENQEWAPRKRVSACRTGITRIRQRIYESRSALGEASHIAWRESVNQQDIGILNETMSPLITEHVKLHNKEMRFKRSFLRFKSKCGKILRCLGLRRLLP
ncbi:MAG: hypothetical protein CMP85_03585 [Gammaproteobacteria bacterium]|nr:hypothetical protein [Gammaproteobacteria bacterium]